MIHGAISENLKLKGLFNSARMEQLGNNLLFSSRMEDVGEEFVLVIHSGRLLIVRICLSPPKCPIETYHEYIKAFSELVSFPAVGVRSIAGSDSNVGREPNIEEFTYALISKALTIFTSVNTIKADLPKHERGIGGATGIDAIRTLESWKNNPNWYKTVESKTTLIIKGKSISPIRATPKEARLSNKFIGAVSAVLQRVNGRIPKTAAGNLSSALLSAAINRVSSLDAGTAMSITEATTYLRKTKLPKRSKTLTDLIHSFENCLKVKPLHFPILNGVNPYFINAPEQIFQLFAIARCLIALGLPVDDLRKSLSQSATNKEIQFGSFIAWVDTDKHGVTGWRDNTAVPSNYMPDLIIVNKNNGKKLLLDAKFRRSNDKTKLLSASSIKDMQAYMQEYELSKAVILVPYLNDELLTEDIKTEKYWIRGVSIIPSSSNFVTINLAQHLNELWNESNL